MRVHWLQHVWFEGLGAIHAWAERRGHAITVTRLYDGESVPNTSDFDILVVMGGPMNIYEEGNYPWLRAEKAFIRNAILQDRGVLGICLGAQLIADVLGAQVVKGPYREIGWWPMSILNKDKDHPLKDIPNEVTCFHWHSDMFEIPDGAVCVAETKGCPHQGFSYNDGLVIGLQCHLEMTVGGLSRILAECGDEIIEGMYIQAAHEISRAESYITQTNEYMYLVLNELEKRVIQRRGL